MSMGGGSGQPKGQTLPPPPGPSPGRSGGDGGASGSARGAGHRSLPPITSSLTRVMQSRVCAYSSRLQQRETEAWGQNGPVASVGPQTSCLCLRVQAQEGSAPTGWCLGVFPEIRAAPRPAPLLQPWILCLTPRALSLRCPRGQQQPRTSGAATPPRGCQPVPRW